MVDIDFITRRLRDLDRRVGLLRRLAGQHDVDRYRHEVALQAQVERHLQIAIQLVIDVAAHIIADDTGHVPEDYSDTFTLLAAEKIIADDLALVRKQSWTTRPQEKKMATVSRADSSPWPGGQVALRGS